LNNKELEELIYDYGHVMYRIGRMETDDKVSSKEYSKLTSQKEITIKKFDEYFKSSSKIAKTLNLA